MRQIIRKKSSGFTLIEMIVVIIILGVLAAGISTFISLSTKIYTEATDRDQLVSSARFAIERLNREVRNALPNSLRLTDSNQCLEFTPIIESTIYTKIPVAPDSITDEITVIRFEEAFDNNWSVIVYPLTHGDVYPVISSDFDKIHAVKTINATGNKWVITLKNQVQFSEHSPTQRLYFINGNDTVLYCLLEGNLTRNGILMAQDIGNTNPFEIQPATLQRNAMVQIHFRFEKNNEQVTFNNEIQVLNVP